MFRSVVSRQSIYLIVKEFWTLRKSNLTEAWERRRKYIGGDDINKRYVNILIILI